MTSPTPHGRSVAIPILIADDDEEDHVLIRDALAEARLANDLHFVRDGEELMQYLRAEGPYREPASAPRPGLLLLDLKMPKMDGFECLRQIRADAALRRIPVVILTTSRADTDIYRSYDLGVNSFISKPVTFDQLVDAMRAIGEYWLQIVALPPASRESPGGDSRRSEIPPASPPH